MKRVRVFKIVRDYFGCYECHEEIRSKLAATTTEWVEISDNDFDLLKKRVTRGDYIVVCDTDVIQEKELNSTELVAALIQDQKDSDKRVAAAEAARKKALEKAAKTKAANKIERLKKQLAEAESKVKEKK